MGLTLPRSLIPDEVPQDTTRDEAPPTPGDTAPEPAATPEVWPAKSAVLDNLRMSAPDIVAVAATILVSSLYS